MDNFKKILRRLLYPGIALVIIFTVFSTVFLVYAFICLGEEHPVSGVAYFFSAYTLTVLVFNIIPIIKKGKNIIYQNPYTSRYLNEAELRARISLYTGLVVNLIYALFKLFTGVLYQSFWLGAVAVYYMVLFLIRFILLRNNRISEKRDTSDSRRLHQLKSYQICGGLLFVLNIAMSGMIFQMIWQNKNYSYPGFIIYASAAYTFYRLTLAVINVFKFRKINNPIFSAAKALDLAVAFMSLFALQTAMLTEFGGTDDNFKRIMNAITGCAVSAFVFGMAVFMMVRSFKQLKEAKNTSTQLKKE